jgi:phage protein D/phage baseplate assembly protein gpV
MPVQQQQHTGKFQVQVEDQELAPEAERMLIAAVVDDNLNLPDLFSLTFRDPEHTALAAAGLRIGAEVKISLISEQHPGGEPLISGEVTALEAEHTAGGTFAIARGFDHSHRLFRGRRTETYTNVTYADVARTVATRAGLKVGKIDPTPGVHQHVSQGNLSDWQFLRALASEIGYEVVVIDNKLELRNPAQSGKAPGGGTLDSQNPLQLSMGGNLLRLRAVVTSAEQVKEVQVRGWDVGQKRALVGSAPAATESASLPLTPAGLAGTFDAVEFVATNVPYRTQAEVDAAAKALANQLAGAFAELEGVARGNPKLKAGTPVSLALAGEPFDGKYTLSSSRHVLDPESGYTTWFTVTGRQERSLLSLSTPGGNGSAPPPLHGVAVAQVTDVRDPDELGRVKLKYPWMSDSYVSDWARVMQPGAGPERGAVILPEVNDEVLVAFEHGDLRRPYVVGGLYNGVDKPKLGDKLVDGATGAVRRRGFVSKRGHLLVFFDDEADEGVALLTGDSKLRVALDRTKTVIHVASDGRVEIDATQDITIKAGKNLVLEAGATMELKAKAIKATADGPVEVKGQPIKLN